MKRQPCLFLLSNLGVGGSEKKTVSMVNRLAGRGWAVHLGFLGGSEHLLPSVSPEVRTVAIKRQGRVDLNAVRRLHSYLKEHRIGVIWNINQFPVLYSWLAARDFSPRIRQVVGINTTDFGSRYERLQMVLYAPLLRRMDAVVFGCTAQRSAWAARYRLPPERLRVLYNGMEMEYFSVLPAVECEARRNGALTLGMVAQFRPEKGHGVLLEAIARLRASGLVVRAVLIGDGPEQLAVRALVDRLGLSNAVEFPGQVADVRPYLAAVDAFVLPSVAVETFSNAALEAMAAGLPVILSDIGGAAEMIVDGESGVLCHPGDVGALASAIQRVADPAARAALGAAARVRVAAKFSIDDMIQGYEAVLAC